MLFYFLSSFFNSDETEESNQQFQQGRVTFNLIESYRLFNSLQKITSYIPMLDIVTVCVLMLAPALLRADEDRGGC